MLSKHHFKHNLNKKSKRFVCAWFGSLLGTIIVDHFSFHFYLQFTLCQQANLAAVKAAHRARTNANSQFINYDRTDGGSIGQPARYITLDCWENKFTTDMRLTDSLAESHFKFDLVNCSTEPVLESAQLFCHSVWSFEVFDRRISLKFRRSRSPWSTTFEVRTRAA